MDPKFQAKLEELRRRVLEQPGALRAAVRKAAADGDRVADDVSTYVDKVRRHAYKVTDEDVRALIAAGYSEDQIFELTVATAYGAARRRLHAGLAAMAARPSASQGAERGDR